MHRPSAGVYSVCVSGLRGLVLRSRSADNFEIAALPTTSPEERKRLLTFVVCGGGPTGVETAAVRGVYSCV
jgi:hypothetical protein